MPSKECQREKILKLLKNSYLPLEMEVNYIAVHNSFVPKVKSFQNRVSVGSSVDHCGSLYEVRRDYQCIMQIASITQIVVYTRGSNEWWTSWKVCYNFYVCTCSFLQMSCFWLPFIFSVFFYFVHKCSHSSYEHHRTHTPQDYTHTHTQDYTRTRHGVHYIAM